VATVTLTAAQILNIWTTPVEIIPAPGVGFFTWVHDTVFDYRFGTTAYVSGYSLALQYALDTGPGDWLTNQGLGLSSSYSILVFSADNNLTEQRTLAENSAVNVWTNAFADPTAGDGVLKVTVKYETVALL
jgi:hypothetical protein